MIGQLTGSNLDLNVTLAVNFPVGLDVTWFSANERSLPDPYLKNWLLDTGSLTERVQSLCHQFSLELLGQGECEIHNNEASCLGFSSNENITDHQVREIVLCGNQAPWVFARSVIPNGLVEEELANLGTQPLGKRLFNDERFKRSAFELCQVSANTFGYANNQQLWGRRSVFTFNDYRMIVAEVFLPNAPAYETRYHQNNENE